MDDTTGTLFDLPPSIRKEPSAVDDVSLAKPDLLIVDDDPLITDTLDFVLGRDFNVFVADSRAAVKSLLRQRETPPQLALIDLGLPPMPHPGAVRVILIFTVLRPSSPSCSSQRYTRPRSTMLTGISGS